MSKGKGVGDGIMVVWGREWRSIGPSGHSERQSGWQVVEDMGLERLKRPSSSRVMLGEIPSRALLC